MGIQQENVIVYLHVVCEYADTVYIEFVTAYIPDEDGWERPTFTHRKRKMRWFMTTKPTPICGQHNREKEWCPTVFEYSEEGISVRVPNVYAWVCPEDGEASFTPETVDELIVTVREFIETAKRAKERRSSLTEYVVAVG